MKTNKLIKNVILSACALAVTSPLFIAENSQEAISENKHLVSSLYRKISSVDKANENKENKEEKKEGEVIQESEEVSEKSKQEKAITLCENKKKIEDLDKEIKKLEEEKDKVGKIIAKLNDDEGQDNEDDKLPTTFSNDVLTQLLFQQIYLNRMLSQSLMSSRAQSRQGLYFGDARWISGSSTANMSPSQLNNYASMALYNQLAVGVQGNQFWSPQFNQNGSLSNSYYDVERSNPYSNNYSYGNNNQAWQSTFL